MRRNRFSYNLLRRRGIGGRRPRRRHTVLFSGGRRRSKKKHGLRWWYLFFTIILLFLILRQFNDVSAYPAILAMSQMKIQTISSKVINDSVAQTLRDLDIDTSRLATYEYNNEGEIVRCGVNTVLINEISADMIGKMAQNIEVENVNVLYVPIGKVFGNGLLSNYGPKMKVSIRPAGTFKINYGRAFVSTGINQVNYRVWLEVEMKMQVVIPFDKRTVTVKQDVIMVDQVMNGRVPNSYVNVPDTDSMLNVIPE